jgi:hypothetical protein
MKQVPTIVLIIIGIFVFICCGCGIAGSLGASNWFSNRADKIEKLPTTTNVNTGEDTVLTGTLDGNTVLANDPDAGDISEYGLVMYQFQRYDRTTRRNNNGGNRTSGSWDTVRTEFQPLTMTVNGETIRFDRKGSFSINGDLTTYNLDGGSTTDGSRRLRGFRNGDLVTIVAEKQSDGSFKADEIYGGTRDDLIKNTRTAATIFRYCGYGMVVVGGVLGLVLVVLLIIARQAAKTTAPPPPPYVPPTYPTTPSF